MTDSYKILSVVVTYNAMQRGWINKCLGSLKNSLQQTDILVVDNCSTDDTVNEIEKKFRWVRLIKSTVNLGFAKGNNLGFKKALEENYDFIFLLNQDAWITETTIGHLVKCQIENREYGIVSPIHLNGEGDNLEEVFATFLITLKGEGRQFYFDHIMNNEIKNIYEVDYVHAACWLISKECFRKIGMFDDVLFTQYGEDDNYLSRTRYFKYKIGIVSQAIVYHDTEFREKRKTKHSFDNSFLHFNVTGANILDVGAVEKMDQMVKKDKSIAYYYLKRLNFLKYKKYLFKYREEVEQKKIILKQREKYLNFNAERF